MCGGCSHREQPLSTLLNADPIGVLPPPPPRPLPRPPPQGVARKAHLCVPHTNPPGRSCSTWLRPSPRTQPSPDTWVPSHPGLHALWGHLMARVTGMLRNLKLGPWVCSMAKNPYPTLCNFTPPPTTPFLAVSKTHFAILLRTHSVQLAGVVLVVVVAHIVATKCAAGPLNPWAFPQPGGVH